MNSIRFVILIFVITLSLTACKKYPEGGYQWRAKKHLKESAWHLTLYEVNGIDSTDLINYNGSESFKEMQIFKSGSSYELQTHNADSYRITFDDRKEITILSSIDIVGTTCNYGYCYRKYFSPEGPLTQSWTIVKLTKKELILSQSKNKSYKLKFIRK